MDTQSLLDAMEGVAILLDDQFVIRAVGQPNWSDCFTENGFRPPAATEVIGQPILSYFAADTVKAAYHRVFSDVLAHRRKAVKIGYRCDSAVVRRDMLLAVTPCPPTGDAKGLLYQSIELARTVRPPINLFNASVSRVDAKDLLTICSICAKVAVPKGAPAEQREWIEAQEYYRRGGRDEVLLSHGFCRPCFHRLMLEDGLEAA